ncbi:MAG: ester cyclase [bacterium]
MELTAQKHIIQRYYHELWNQWKLVVADEIISYDVQFRGSLALRSKGLDGFLKYMEFVRKAFPDFHNEIDELIAEPGKVVARLTYRGTHQGKLFGIPPTNKKIAYAGVAIFYLSENKITEGWVLGDTLSLMKQLRTQ